MQPGAVMAPTTGRTPQELSMDLGKLFLVVAIALFIVGALILA
jgi:hypothetical protein